MNHDELQHHLTERMDRMEDRLGESIIRMENKLDAVLPTVVESKTRIDSLSTQVKALWTVIVTTVGGAIKLLLGAP